MSKTEDSYWEVRSARSNGKGKTRKRRGNVIMEGKMEAFTLIGRGRRGEKEREIREKELRYVRVQIFYTNVINMYGNNKLLKLF